MSMFDCVSAIVGLTRSERWRPMGGAQIMSGPGVLRFSSIVLYYWVTLRYAVRLMAYFKYFGGNVFNELTFYVSSCLSVEIDLTFCIALFIIRELVLLNARVQ